MGETIQPRSSPWLTRAVFFALLVGVVPAFAAETPRSQSSARENAEAQFDRAQKQHAALEAIPLSRRTEDQYLQLIKAYRRVYLLTASAKDIPFAIFTVGNLYREMGDRFDRKYFQSAVDSYQFLEHEYPTNRYREEALFAIGQIQLNDLNDAPLAQKTFETFLQLHPRSPRVKEVKEALADIAAPHKPATQAAKKSAPPIAPPIHSETQSVVQNRPSTPAPTDSPSAAPSRISAAEIMEEPSPDKTAEMREIKAWTTPDYTRVVIALDGPIKCQAARISNPDRIYFDVTRSKLSHSLGANPIVVEGDLVKAIRVAQNHPDVVRVVLEVSKIKDYSVFLLKDPYRMVVDLYPKAPETATAKGNAPHRESSEELAADAALAKANSHSTAPSQTQTGNSGPSSPPSTSPSGNPAGSSTATGNSSNKSTNSGTRQAHSTPVKLSPPTVPSPTHDGGQSLTRALGLKIGRIVIDAGHGGHDTGTIGPNGLMEKDLCLDVALRLGKMIEEHLPGAEIIYTRSDDTFVPLEERTAMANQAKADLFISIHANSSPDPNARGVETYYLNFSPSPEAMEVAARENATAQGNIRDLDDMIQRIARNEKIEESRELAGDIQDSLSKRLQKSNHAIKNRGVRKAPFVVLLGANMPSVLAEISFISNPSDESSLKKSEGRDHVAEGLYKGIEAYLQSINSLAFNQVRTPPNGRSGVAQPGNQR